MCDWDGSVDITCDASNGMCTCVPGRVGNKCERKILIFVLKQDWKLF